MTQQTHAQIKANKRAAALKENLKKRKALIKNKKEINKEDEREDNNAKS